MMKSFYFCDCCGKKLEESGIKFVQPVAIVPLTIHGTSSKRTDVQGVDFCSKECLLAAVETAINVNKN